MSIIKRKAGSEDIVKSVLEFDDVPTEGSHNLVESGAVAKAIGNLGQPLQWKGPATVAELNAGITGIQPGWTYTLTDAGTLTDGSVAVEAGDEVAWTEDSEWFKVGHDSTTKDIQKMIDDAVYSSEIAILSNITPANNTLRFSFSQKDYDPTVDGVGTSGTWTKLNTTQSNVWDWTNTNTSWSSAFDAAFSSPSNKVKVISAGDTSSITSLYRLFRDCSSLESICLFDTSSVLNISTMLSNTAIEAIPEFDLISCTNASYFATGCSNLKTYKLRNTGNLTSILQMFRNCQILEKIELFSTASVSEATRAFAGCQNVKSGSLAMYEQMSTQTTPPSTYADCFTNCGSNTTTGSAELAQIPQSWGGTMTTP